jgi:hypothetical protein
MPEVVFAHGLPSLYLVAFSYSASHRARDAGIFLFITVLALNILGNIPSGHHWASNAGFKKGVKISDFCRGVVEIFAFWLV